MKVLSYYCPKFADIGEPNSRRWEDYCAGQGLTWVCYKPTILSYTPALQKIVYLICELNASDEDVLWVDMDVVVTDLCYDIRNIFEQSKRDVLISQDEWGLCTGFMLVRNTAWTKQFFQTLMELRYLKPELRERLYGQRNLLQHSIKYLVEGFESVDCHFFLLSTEIISNPQCTFTAPFHHYWTNERECCMAKTMILKDLKHHYDHNR